MRSYRPIMLAAAVFVGSLSWSGESEARRGRCGSEQIYRPSIGQCVSKSSAIRQGIYSPRHARTKSIRYSRSARYERRAASRYERRAARREAARVRLESRRQASSERSRLMEVRARETETRIEKQEVRRPGRFDDIIARNRDVPEKVIPVAVPAQQPTVPVAQPASMIITSPTRPTKNPFGTLVPVVPSPVIR